MRVTQVWLRHRRPGDSEALLCAATHRGQTAGHGASRTERTSISQKGEGVGAGKQILQLVHYRADDVRFPLHYECLAPFLPLQRTMGRLLAYLPFAVLFPSADFPFAALFPLL